MPDDSLGGPQEFNPEEPLLVVIPNTAQCWGILIDGLRCLRRIPHDRAYCIAHEPTPETVLGTLYQRMQTFVQNCASCGPASAAELITLAHVAKAFSILWDRKVTMDEAKKTIEKVGWRMKEIA